MRSDGSAISAYDLADHGVGGHGPTPTPSASRGAAAAQRRLIAACAARVSGPAIRVIPAARLNDTIRRVTRPSPYYGVLKGAVPWL